MKLLGYLLAVYLLFLAFEPGIKDVVGHVNGADKDCCVELCQKGSGEDVPDEDCPAQNNCGSGACHPFEVCKIGVGPNTLSGHIEAVTASSRIDAFPILQETPYGDAHCDVWQPPRFS